MAKFQIITGKQGGGILREDFDKDEVVDIPTAEAWARKTVERFNDTLRSGEEPREFVRVEWVDTGAGTLQHKWQKASLMTEGGGGTRLHDRYQCTRCGATGKRYGLGETVSRDHTFRAKAWDVCRSDDSEAREIIRKASRVMLVQNLSVTGICVAAQCSDGETRQLHLNADQKRSVLNYCQHRLQGGRLRLQPLQEIEKDEGVVEVADQPRDGKTVNRALLQAAFVTMFGLIQRHHDASLPKIEAGKPCAACEASTAEREAQGMKDAFTLMALAMTELEIAHAETQPQPARLEEEEPERGED